MQAESHFMCAQDWSLVSGGAVVGLSCPCQKGIEMIKLSQGLTSTEGDVVLLLKSAIALMPSYTCRGF